MRIFLDTITTMRMVPIGFEEDEAGPAGQVQVS